MLQNQFFEIMEDVKMNNESDKPTGSTPQGQVPKPATGTTGPAGSTAKPAPAKTPAVPKTTAPKPSATSVTATKAAAEPAKTPAKTTSSRSTAKPPAKPTAGEAPGTSIPVPKKISKKLAKDFKKLKVQQREIASLEKNRDRLMKDLISAIENKKKSKKIRSLARDFNRIEKRVKNRTASYLGAKKKLTKKMK